jgi:hypothetical protein
MLRRPLNMIVSKRSHEVVAMVVVGLHAELDALVITGFLGCLDKVLRKELALLVEIISSALAWSTIYFKTVLWEYAPHR